MCHLKGNGIMRITLDLGEDGEITEATIDGVALARRENLRLTAFKEGYLNGILTFHLVNFHKANPGDFLCIHSPSCYLWCVPLS
jgi:hypothetical protein